MGRHNPLRILALSPLSSSLVSPGSAQYTQHAQPRTRPKTTTTNVNWKWSMRLVPAAPNLTTAQCAARKSLFLLTFIAEYARPTSLAAMLAGACHVIARFVVCTVATLQSAVGTMRVHANWNGVHLGHLIMKLHRYIDHDSQMTPIDFQGKNILTKWLSLQLRAHMGACICRTVPFVPEPGNEPGAFS
ncbi:hypothetical protein DPMN_082724 [Dreissena polymorpha]|uniref:Secreted protein n=1 Tax=Dreissena polymorpha TaxID=45954 RepID=A0A9D3YB97_DREPO|nr:hypothetical protein DPMN_082724 [Dreissena polymorpha]